MEELVKVVATDASKRLRVKIKELGRLADNGEEFMVASDRLNILCGNNKFKTPFVVLVDEPTESTTEQEEKPKRKRRSKKTEDVVEEDK